MCVAEAFAPDDAGNEQRVAVLAAEGGPAGVHLDRAVGPLRPRAAGRHRGPQRLDRADRLATARYVEQGVRPPACGRR